jgi:hypothetical protein
MMPRKKPGMTPEEQSRRFRDAAQKMIDAGELNPTEADIAFRRTLGKIKSRPDKAP